MLGIGVGVAVPAMLLVSAVWMVFSPESPLNRPSALATTREWARLEEFPKTARRIHIETRGSMFTREFIVTFEAPAADVCEWLEKSEGTRAATAARMDDGWNRYSIKPGGGAQFAEVKISSDGIKVRIHVYWS